MPGKSGRLRGLPLRIPGNRPGKCGKTIVFLFFPRLTTQAGRRYNGPILIAVGEVPALNGEQIRTFLILMDTRSFTKTAAAVHKSQSVVSRQISRMEEELGFPLFVRGSRLCVPTAAGTAFAEGARELARNYETLVARARQVDSGHTGRLAIGMHGGEVSSQYSEILNSFGRAYPHIAVSLEEYRLEELTGRLTSFELDLAFVVASGPWYAAEKSKLRFIPSGIRHSCLYIHKSHPLFGADPAGLSLRDFAGDEFVVFLGYEPDPRKGPTARLLRTVGADRIRGCRNLNSAVMLLYTGNYVMINSTRLSLTNNPDFRKLYFPGMDSVPEAVAWSAENMNPCVNTFTNFLEDYLEKHPSTLTEDEFYP